MARKPKSVEEIVVGHPVSLLKIKSARVDKDIQPVVAWLNSFDSIYTRWSCQGGAPPPFDELARPYVLFYCEDAVDLIQVIRSLVGYATVNVTFYEAAGCLRYVADFVDQDALQRFTNELPKVPWIARPKPNRFTNREARHAHPAIRGR